jgi:hypothetical protein
MEAVLNHSKAEGGARLVLISIASHADDNGANAYPGVKRICEQTKLSERAVKYGLKELLTLGEISTESVGGGRIPSSYRVNLPIENKPARGAKRDTPGVQNEAFRGANTAPLISNEGCKMEQAGVQNTTGRGAKYDIAYKEEPEIEPEIEPEKREENHDNQDALAPALSPLRFALVEICRLPETLSPKVYADLCAVASALEAQARSPDAVREFGRRWFADDWRGKRGDAPKLWQVNDEWLQILGGNGNATNGNSDEQQRERIRKLREQRRANGGG